MANHIDQTNIVSRKHSDEKQAMAQELRIRQTEAEAALWNRVKNNQLGVKIRRQQIIDGFIADFYCHRSGRIFELDGGIHERTKEYDRERDAILAARGLQIIRISNDRVLNDIEGVVREIRSHITKALSHRNRRIPLSGGEGVASPSEPGER
jgi:very-short-patch-repair endonuclease